MPTKKTSKSGSNYSVVLLVRYIVSVEVDADDEKQAIEKAIKTPVLADGIEVIDGKTEVAGYDNLDLWRNIP